MKIGFIGLGNMGAPMARNLASAGHNVTGYDIVAVSVAGVDVVSSIDDVVKGCDAVITMLPNGKILRDAAASIIPIMEKGSIFIDCSTVDIQSARTVADEATEKGLLTVDAPVSGGVNGAIAGQLTFMAGGSEASYQVAQPLFEIMGKKSVHCGDSGAGQAAKICNNMILGVTMIGTCEAFALADGLGLSRQKMFDVVSTSSGYSWSMNEYCPAAGVGVTSPADRNYEPGFASELMLKDLRLSQEAAKIVGTDTKLSTVATEIYSQFVEEGEGLGKDFSAILLHLLRER